MDKKIGVDLRTHNRMLKISIQLHDLGSLLWHKQRSDAADDEAP